VWYVGFSESTLGIHKDLPQPLVFDTALSEGTIRRKLFLSIDPAFWGEGVALREVL
jgi:hypothetical protein